MPVGAKLIWKPVAAFWSVVLVLETQKTQLVVALVLDFKNNCTRPVPSFIAVPVKVVFAYCDRVSQNNLPDVCPVIVPYHALLLTEYS